MSELIRVRDGLIVHPTEILRAERNGNYTDVWIRGKLMEQIWDEHHKLWWAITDAAEPKP